MSREPIDPDTNQVEVPIRRRIRRPGRRVLWTVGPLLVVLFAVALAPSIVSVTPLKGWIVRKIVPADQGTLKVDQLTLGWFTNLKAEGVTLDDSTGQTLVVAPRIEIDRTLWQLLSKKSHVV